MAPAFQTANSADATDKMSRALGQAVARCWSRLSQEAQQDLFESAVESQGEAIRQQLAIFLHGQHARTLDALHPQAPREPDKPAAAGPMWPRSAASTRSSIAASAAAVADLRCKLNL